MVPIALGQDVFLENNDKYSIVHENGSALWTLVVDFLTEQDSGQYECNVHQRIIYFKLRVKSEWDSQFCKFPGTSALIRHATLTSHEWKRVGHFCVALCEDAPAQSH